MEQQLTIVAFCAAECARQQSGEASVARMVCAYNVAIQHASERISADLVCELASLIDFRNTTGYRHVPVFFANGTILNGDHDAITRGMEMLLTHGQDTLTPWEFYRRFEDIHPFVDGNGRVGAILFNWAGGTLDKPTMPLQQHRAWTG